MPTVEYPTNPNTDTAFVTDDGGKRTRSLKTVLVDGTIDYPKSANVKDCYVTIDGKKQRALMTADVSKDGVVEYPDGSNSTKGYVTVDGKKHRVVLTATLAGGVKNEDIKVTQNGTYTASEGYTGLGTVEVEVPAPVISSLSVTPTTSAQTITAPEGTDGYNPVNVSAVTASIDANIQAENIKKDVTILGVTGTLEGGSGGKYQLLQRIKDDSNNEIGTVCGFFVDNNDTEYAVVCLDAQFRTDNTFKWSDGNFAVATIPQYQNLNVYATKETGTVNSNAIFAKFGTGYAPSVEECQSHSFVLGGITYTGQLPNIIELINILRYRTEILNLDTSTGPTISETGNYWSSTQGSSSSAWLAFGGSNGTVMAFSRSNLYKVIPILELPNA